MLDQGSALASLRRPRKQWEQAPALGSGGRSFRRIGKGWGKVQVEYQVTVDTLLVVESNYSVGMRYRSW